MLSQSRGSVASRMFALALALLVCSSSIAVAQQAQAPAVDLPDGKAVYDQYIEATGGRERFASLKSSRLTGTMEVPGMKAPIVINRERPGKLTINIVFERVGEINQGTNGEIAWDISPMTGVQILDGVEKDDMIKRADFDEEINPEKYYKSIVCTSAEEYDGKQCYVVEFTDKNDNVEKRYFDAESHLMVKVETKRDTKMMGEVDVVSKLSDYRDVGGMKVAFKNEMALLGTSQVIQFEEVEFDVDHDAGTFDPPEAIVKLLEKKNAKEADKAEEGSE